MNQDNLVLLTEFRSGVPEPDPATAARIFAMATTNPSRRSRNRGRIGIAVALGAAVIVSSAIAAVTLLGRPAPKGIQATIHSSAVSLFTGHPGLVKATARVVAESPDATLYGISDRQGNYCVELIGASRGLVWSFNCDQGWRVGDRYFAGGSVGSQVSSIMVAGVEPPVVWWGRLTSGTTRAQAVYPDGTTEQIPLGSNGFFVYQPSPDNQLLARRQPMTIQFLRKDGSSAYSLQVLPQQPLAVQGTWSEIISGRALVAGAKKIQIEEWRNKRTPITRYIPLPPNGTFTFKRRIHLNAPSDIDVHLVDRNNTPLTDSLQPMPEKYWRSLVAQAHAKR
jgi:hypothetical protein